MTSLDRVLITVTITGWTVLILVGAPALLATVGTFVLRRRSMARPVERQEPSERASIRSLVVLVHGTFAAGSEWRDLESRLPSCVPGPIQVEYFPWSGGVSLSDRADAVADMTAYLKRKLCAYGNARLYVIAHSHGGNVAANAITDDLALRLERLICLSTPFLVFEPRGKVVGRSMMGASFLVGCLLIAIVPTIGILLAGENFALLGFCAGAVGAVAMYAAWLMTLRKWQEISRRWVDSLDQRVGHTLPICILRSPSDEALMLLAILQGISNLAEVFVRLVGRVDAWVTLQGWQLWRNHLRPLRDRSPGLFALIAMAPLLWPLMLLPVEFGWLDKEFRTVVLAPMLPLVLPVFVLVVLYIALLILAAPFITVMLAAMLLYGGWPMVLAALDRRVSVEPAPPGTWTVVQLKPRKNTFAGLKHSATHADEDALDAICEHLKGDSRITAVKRPERE